MSAWLVEGVRALAPAGGSLALAFIIVVALALGALAVLFLGSAVVVLERFARSGCASVGRGGVVGVARLVFVSVAWAALLGLLGTEEEAVEALGVAWPGVVRAWFFSALLAGFFATVAQSVLALLLRWLSPRALANLGVLMPGAGYALWVGASDAAGYLAAPAAFCALLYVGFVFRASRASRAASVVHESADGETTQSFLHRVLKFTRRIFTNTNARGDAERLSALLALTLGAGLLLPLALEVPSPAVATVGGVFLRAFLALVVLGLLPLAVVGLLESRGSVEWFIARRYLFAKRRQTFISLITGICVAGVAAGVWLIVTVLSVMNGFERTWRDEIIGNRAHLTVHHARGGIHETDAVLATLDALPEVRGASPYLDADGMVRGPRGEVYGVRVRGVDPTRVARVTDLRDDLLPGSEHALENLAADARGNAGLIIGHQLAQSLGAGPGDTLTLISPVGGPPTPLGPAPRLSRFRVAGVFRSSFFQYDEVFAYTDLAGAQNFLRVGGVVSGIEVRTGDHYRSRRVAGAIESALGEPYFTRDWKDFFPAFFQALKTERIMMFVLLTMIMVVAAFAIVVTLIMMIMEKSSDIAILKTMGATDAMVERIFALEGTMIGLLGVAFGLLAGIAVTTQLAWVQEQIETLTGVDTLPAEIYQFANLPWELNVGQLALISALAMVLALGATLLPSRHGARLDPAEALRAE